MAYSVSKTKVCILGATGSIGLNTLDVIERHSEQFEAYALTADKNVESMYKLCSKYRPVFAAMASEEAADCLRKRLVDAGIKTEVLGGASSLVDLASLPEVDTVMAAIVGAAGLLPNLAAVKQGKKVLLANKESLVMSGALFMSEAKRSGSVLLPIDSEHNAIYQCLPDQYLCGQTLDKDIRRILLTASGGPFRSLSKEALKGVSPEDACRHPNWSMGRKISVDSASLMNKGLELIEACWLFDVAPSRVEVHIHPQSIIHSMVEYVDGSVLAQMGNPDMRTPIAYGLAWPDRLEAGVEPLDLFSVGRLDFEQPDTERFPCLALASQAFVAGGTSPAILNAANEEAVEAFLKGNIGFTEIPDTIERVLSGIESVDASSIEVVLEADLAARQLAKQMLRA